MKANKVAALITGVILYVNGLGDFLKNVVFTTETRDDRLTVDLPGLDQ